MEKLVKYETKSEYEENKSLLQTYEDYAALTENEQKVYLKEEDPYFIVNVSGGTAEIKLLDETGIMGDFNTTLTLNEGLNKVIAPYGFYSYDYIKSNKIIGYDFKHYDTSNVTNMGSMFSVNLVNELNLSKFDTSNVTNMHGMFYFSQKLTTLDLSSFNTSNVTDMNTMFANDDGLTSLDLSSFNTRNVTDMTAMFNACRILPELDLSNFDTSNVTWMNFMFSYCLKLRTLYLNNFDTSNVIHIDGMFSNCNSLNYIRCKQSFKDWCITNQDTIELPTQMREGGSGTWDIVG